MTGLEELSAIVALARAGALDLAWKRWRAGEYDRVNGAAAWAVKGRLLKDQAQLASGDERLALYREAAAAYEQSAASRLKSYPLINAATLSMLGADPARCRELAKKVLNILDIDPREPETLYYGSATRAEALLLLGREEEARDIFKEAIAFAPQAWEDHASTLRQFELILKVQGRSASWLAVCRPPRSLHFGGHMSFDAKVVRRAHLDEQVRHLLSQENVGFGYGGLAAGADIIVAEALLARGATLHPVLPGGKDAFAAISVDPFGKVWRRRFDAVLEQVETVRAVRPFGTAPDRATIALADEIAMGAAVMNARRLESNTLQLLVLADERQAEEARERWGAKGWRQQIIMAPREGPAKVESTFLPDSGRRCLALLAVSPAGERNLGERLAQLKRLLRKAGRPAIRPYFTGREVVLAYADPAEAARAAVSLAQAGEAAIGGHYGIAESFEDPFGGCRRVAGDPAAIVESAVASAPPGSVCVTGDFAAALEASGEKSLYSELIGELEARDGSGSVELYAVKPRLN